MREPGQDKEALIPCGSPGLRSSRQAADSAARSHEEKDILNRLPAEEDSGPHPAHAAAPRPSREPTRSFSQGRPPGPVLHALPGPGASLLSG